MGSIYDVNGDEVIVPVPASSSQYGRYIRSIAHRGYQDIAPENTLPAFKLAKQYGFDSCESDVRYTSDGVAVMLHDSSINRTARNADGTSISGTVEIASITYDTALTYDFGVWKSSTYAGEKIPTFEEYITICRNVGLQPYIELKLGTQAQIEALVDVVHYHAIKDATWASSNQTLLNYVASYDEYARIDWFTYSLKQSDITYASGLLNNKREVVIGTGLYDSDSIIHDAIDAGITLECGLAGTTYHVINNVNAAMSAVMSNNLVAGKVLYDHYIA